MEFSLIQALPILKVVVQVLHEVGQVGERWGSRVSKSHVKRGAGGGGHFVFIYIFIYIFVYLCYDRHELTIPCVEHVRDEVVDEGDLGLGNAAGVPVEHGHDHRQTLALLLIRLAGKRKYSLQLICFTVTSFTIDI